MRAKAMSTGGQPLSVDDLTAFTARLDGLRPDQHPDDLSSALRAAFKQRGLYDVYASSLVKDTDRAKAFLEVLDKALQATMYDVTILKRFRQLCGQTGLLPTSHIVPGELIQTTENPVASGAFADVWEGFYNDKRVAMKALRVYRKGDVQKVKKMFCKEVVIWKRISHPNIVPFLGVLEGPAPLCMVSEWMPNGNVRDYVGKNPEASRLQLLLDISRGLSFLHSHEIVHGDLYGDNILVDKSGCARLNGFRFISIASLNCTETSASGFKGSHRWVAPEFFTEGASGLSTRESDMFELGMVTFEVFTGRVPFPEHKSFATVMMRIITGKRPSRPPKGTELGLSDELWRIVQSSLAQEVEKRPSVSTFVDFLEKAIPDIAALKELTGFDANSQGDIKKLHRVFEYGNNTLLGMREKESLVVIEVFDRVLNSSLNDLTLRGRCLRGLQAVSARCGLLPKSYWICHSGFAEPRDAPSATGRISSICQWLMNGKLVAVKTINPDCIENFDTFKRTLYREASIWKLLIHPNIVPFIGVISNPFQIVSEWMSGGNLTTYIKLNQNANRVTLLVDVAKGLDYLHQSDVVHGDLKGSNIMVDAYGCAHIAGFGLTRNQGAVEQTNATPGGTTRWTAPEISGRRGTPSKKGDVFSFAMVMVEAFTGSVPFDLHMSITATLAVMRGERPSRPAHPDFTDKLWTLMERCWNQDPHSRPVMSEVLQDLHNPPTPLQTLRRLSWSSSDFHDRLSNVLDNEEYKRCVPGVQGDNLVWLVDFLDKVLGSINPTSPDFRKYLYGLRDICDTRMILPTSYIVSPSLGHQPVTCVGSDDVYEGTLDGLRVCVKRVRVYPKDNPKKTTKSAYREAVVRKYLKHQNIVPLLGITSTPLQLISDWMPGGDLTGYIKDYPSVDRLNLLFGIAEGLRFLHSCSIVHSDLRGPNILVDATGHARITGFHYAMVAQNSDLMQSSLNDQGHLHITRWTAPEILNEQGTYSREGDVFSFAMVTIEAFTGAIPFDESSTEVALFAIMSGKRPCRPSHLGFTDELWTFTQCWWDQDPRLRPEVSEVLTVLGGSRALSFGGHR